VIEAHSPSQFSLSILSSCSYLSMSVACEPMVSSNFSTSSSSSSNSLISTSYHSCVFDVHRSIVQKDVIKKLLPSSDNNDSSTLNSIISFSSGLNLRNHLIYFPQFDDTSGNPSGFFMFFSFFVFFLSVGWNSISIPISSRLKIYYGGDHRSYVFNTGRLLPLDVNDQEKQFLNFFYFFYI
jgi:hypothetical protein